MTGSAPADEPLDPFDCPRCGATVTERFWGPCTPCRSQLSAAFDRAGGGAAEVEVAATRFEPAMHVVPNHVATKD
ncbi:MAG TPA: hypothetical protein VFN68_10980 [Acidimicrobiales bacterium]|nr:hypothetical protein [Acidimicrobiales bacterium]